MPAAPFVGAVTTRPPEAFSSLTASAKACSHSVEVSRRPAVCAASRSYSSRRRLHLGCASLHAEPAGQRSFRREAVLHALRHRRPDRVETGVDALDTVHRDLIGTRDVAERDAVLLAEGEQLVGGVVGERMPQRLGFVQRVALAADEAAADGIVGLLGEGKRVVGTPRLEGQRVRMARQSRAGFQAEVALRHRDRMPARDDHLAALRAEAGPRTANGVGVAVVGLQPRESRDDRVGRAVAESGRAERAVQRAGDSRDAVQEAGVRESLGEHTSRPHRTDGVRARGTDPDREEIEG